MFWNVHSKPTYPFQESGPRAPALFVSLGCWMLLHAFDVITVVGGRVRQTRRKHLGGRLWQEFSVGPCRNGVGMSGYVVLNAGVGDRLLTVVRVVHHHRDTNRRTAGAVTVAEIERSQNRCCRVAPGGAIGAGGMRAGKRTLACIALLSWCTSALSQDCGPGYTPSGDGSGCTGCVPGKYKSKTGTESCHTCFVGKYSDTENATSQFTCQLCPAGTYLPRNSPK